MSCTQTLDNTHICGQIEANPSRASHTDIEARAGIESNIDLVQGGLWPKMCGKWCIIFIPLVILGVVVGVWVALGTRTTHPQGN
jgi:hypothetical protein